MHASFWGKALRVVAWLPLYTAIVVTGMLLMLIFGTPFLSK